MTVTHPRDVEAFSIPRGVLKAAEAFLRERGRLGAEGVVLLGGATRSGGVLLNTLVIPGQVAYIFEDGVCVDVPGSSAARAIAVLSACGSPVYVKIHTHPTNAYHSEADDANPLMRFDGGTSVVIPNFCRGDLTRLDDWAAYRIRAGSWQWRRVEASNLFAIDDEHTWEVLDHFHEGA